MPFSWDNYPYTNFHELNLDWFIKKFKEIFDEWDALYAEMHTWKDETDANLAEWKTDTEQDISDWESGVISDLNDWEDAFETLFDTTFDNLSQIKEDAEDARDAAQRYAEDAEQSAESIEASYNQITDNKNNITKLENNNVILSDFVAQIDTGISVGTLATGSYVHPTTGANGSLAYGCRSGYIDVILDGFTDRKLPIMVSADFDLNTYKYDIFGYSSHSVSNATESYTNSTWTTEKRTFVIPANGTTCLRIGIIRIDLQGEITDSEAAEIANKIKFYRVTDTTFSKDGIPADSKAVGFLKESIYSYNSIDLINTGILPSYTNNGITYTTNDGYRWIINGTATSASARTIYDHSTGGLYGTDSGKTLKIKVKTSKAGLKLRLYPYINGTLGSNLFDNSTDGYVTLPDNFTGLKVILFVSNGTATNNDYIEFHILNATSNYDLQESILNIDNFNNYVKDELQSTIINTNLWEQGGFTVNGQEYPQTTRIRTKESFNNLNKVIITGNYEFTLFAWNTNGAFVGSLQNDNTFSPSSSTFRKTFDIDSSLNYSYRIVIRNSTNPNADIVISESENCIIYLNTVEENNESINNYKTKIKLFPYDGMHSISRYLYNSIDSLAQWETINNNEYYKFGVKNGGYVDSHITNYTNYPLKAYYINGNREYLGYNGNDPSVTSNYYKILSPYTNDGAAVASGDGLFNHKSVLITSGFHGDEKATPNEVVIFMNNLINNPEYGDLLSSYDFCFIPVVNPWGYDNESRDTKVWDSDSNSLVNVNINRDFPASGTPLSNEAKFVKSIFLNNNYDIVIDLHQHTWDYDYDHRSYLLAFGCVESRIGSDNNIKSLYNTISNVCAESEKAVKTYYNITNSRQTAFTWQGISESGANQFIDYAVDLSNSRETNIANYAVQSETSTYCYVYSNSTTKYNNLSNTYGNTFNDKLLCEILRKFLTI